MEQKYKLFTERPTLEELKPSTKPAQPLADQLIQKPETQPAQPISISLAIPQTNNKNLIIAGSVGFLVILIIILVMRFRK